MRTSAELSRKMSSPDSPLRLTLLLAAVGPVLVFVVTRVQI